MKIEALFREDSLLRSKNPLARKKKEPSVDRGFDAMLEEEMQKRREESVQDDSWRRRAKMIGINMDAITEQDVYEMERFKGLVAVRDSAGKVIDFVAKKNG